MSATEIIEQLKGLPEDELDKVFASLAENKAWRQDLLDMLTIEARRDEPAEPLDAVLKDLGIQA
jgi:hypothetical protein